MSRSIKRRQKIVIWMLVFGFVASIVVAGGIGLLTPPQPGGPEETVLTVNGRKTTRQEFARAYGNLIEAYRQLYARFGMDFEPLLQGTEGAFRRLRFQRETAEAIVQMAIIEQAARELRVTIPRAELDAAVAEQYQTLLTQQGITEEQLAEFLRFQGTTLAAFKGDLARRQEAQMREERVRRVVVGPVEPTDAELTAYYEANRERYQTEPERIRVGHILVREARLADELLGKVMAPGADFAALARAHSLDEATRDRGGETDWFSQAESPFSARVLDAIWPAEVGQVKLADDDAGFHVLKLLERREATVPPFAEIRDRVRADYVREEEGERWDEWYTARRERVVVRPLDPILAAAMALEADRAQALAALVAARDAGTAADPHLDYFIGRLPEELLITVAARRIELEGRPTRTPDEEAELARLRTEEANHTEGALTAYLAFIETGAGDDAFFQRLLARAPQSAEARYALAETHRQAGRWIEAEAEYRQAIEIKPDFVAAHIGRGDVLMALELYRSASEAYRAALDLRPGDVALSLKLAAAYVRDNQLALAQPLLQSVLAREPNNATALILLGDLLLAQGDAAGAIARYTAAYTRGRTADALLKLAGAYLAAGRTAEARERYEDAIRRFRHRPEGHLGLGDALRELGERSEALRAYREALRFAGAVPLRETIARRIVDLDPTDIRMRHLLAGLLREQRKFESAIGQYEAILALAPGDLDALTGLGESYLGRVQYDRALDHFRQALAVAAVPRQRLSIYDRMVAVEEARVGAGNPVGPQGLEILWQRAQLHRELVQNDRAIADLERIRSADPTFRAEEVTALLAALGAPRPQ